MDLSQVTGFISSVGFPIATTAALFWYMVKDGREQRKVIENNTLMLNRILEHLSEDEDDGET